MPCGDLAAFLLMDFTGSTFTLYCPRKGGTPHMRIAVCDDQQASCEQLVQALRAQAPACQPECFASGAALLQAAAQPGQPGFDLVFLDVYMPGENGVEIAAELRRLCPRAAIVFATASREHAVEAFGVQALHYLVKPVTEQDIVEIFRRLGRLQNRARPTLTLGTGRDSRTLYLDEIYYVKSVNHAKELYLTDGRLVRVWMLMEELEPLLGEKFLKLNRSTIVNMDQIEQMGAAACILRDGTRLDFARRERAAVRAAYDSYLFDQLAQRENFNGG